jgi:heat-inducible transcriptional repressor
MSLIPPEASLTTLDERARDIFRKIVESYLETGEPVGSRTLSRGGVQLSPASIRNTMQDLTAAGLLGAPHASAGRLPTHAGLRIFVDGLLELGDVGEEEKREIEARLAGKGRSFGEALDEASSVLSGLAAARASWSRPSATPGSSTSSSSSWGPIRPWPSWSSTTARSRTA